MPINLKKKNIINIVKNYNDDSEKVKELIAFVKSGNGLEYTTKKMLEYRDKALKILNTFEDTPARQSLTELLNYTIERNF